MVNRHLELWTCTWLCKYFYRVDRDIDFILCFSSRTLQPLGPIITRVTHSHMSEFYLREPFAGSGHLNRKEAPLVLWITPVLLLLQDQRSSRKVKSNYIKMHIRD